MRRSPFERQTQGSLIDAHSDSRGFYTFPVLPVGHYELEVQATGFSGYQRKGIVLDTNAALTLDASLEVGGVAQTVSVNDNTLHVETTSTQMGQVITGRQMTAVPLNGRSYTDLLSLQPGVAPATSITSTPCRTWARPFSILRARSIPAPSP